MNLTDAQKAEIRQRLAALTAERDRVVAEMNRTASWLNGRIAELGYWLEAADQTAVADTEENTDE